MDIKTKCGSCGGSKPVFSNHLDLEQKLNDYFDHCKKEGEFPNVVGMSVFAGFASRTSLHVYEKRSPEFKTVIKRAKSRLYDRKFQLACAGKMDKTTFIFDAVNNHDMFNTRTENKNSNEHYGKDGKPIEVTNLPPELAEIADKYEQKN